MRKGDQNKQKDFELFFIQISKHKTSWIQYRMGSENKYRGEHLQSPPLKNECRDKQMGDWQ